MMMDGKGCALIAGIIAAIGFIIGLLLHWAGLVPWWAPLLGLGLPIVGAFAFVIWGIASWMADGSH